MTMMTTEIPKITDETLALIRARYLGYAGCQDVVKLCDELQARRAADPTEAQLDELVSDIVGEVAELPDRTSPDSDPTAMLVTEEELCRVLEARLAAHFGRLALGQRELEAHVKGVEGMKVYLLTKGDGSDGNEWSVISIHSTRILAEKAKALHESPRSRPDGSTYTLDADVEEWDVDDNADDVTAPTPALGARIRSVST